MSVQHHSLAILEGFRCWQAARQCSSMTSALEGNAIQCSQTLRRIWSPSQDQKLQERGVSSRQVCIGGDGSTKAAGSPFQMYCRELEFKGDCEDLYMTSADSGEVVFRSQKVSDSDRCTSPRDLHIAATGKTHSRCFWKYSAPLWSGYRYK